MSFPRYSEYKYSGIKHLGTIPVHWNYLRARAAGNFSASGIDKKINSDEITVRMFNYLDVYNNKEKILRYNDNLMETTTTREKILEHSVRNGDLLFTPSSETADDIGHTAIVKITNETVVYSYHLLRFRPKNILDSDFLKYYFNSIATRSYFESVCTGTTRMVLVREDFKNVWLTYPSIQEQKLIAIFLDQQTAKIDKLVTEQEKLIELLKEKRQAVISHAVTKGLDPQVKTKDSGNLWLKQVPGNWKVGRLKHIKSPQKNAFVDGPFGSNLKSEHFIDNGDVYVIESNFATQGILELEKLKTISFKHFETINRSEVRFGDIVIAKIGAQYGKSSILPAINKRAVVSGNSLKLTVNPIIADVKFVNWFLVTLKSMGVIEDIVNATAQPALSLGELNNLPMLIPSLEEQREIVDYLETVLNKFQFLVDEATSSIELLIERRSALISAAVTGQIDVLHYQPKEVA